jgi:hypothetical protein
MKRGAWATDLLHALGNTSPDQKTINFVASWTLGENTLAKFNPLATTQPMTGSTCFNCPLANVQNYLSHAQGIEATVKTLNNGRYPHIVEGLKTNDPEQAVNAVELGTWGTGLGFTNLWRLGDHREEQLLSHSGKGDDMADKIDDYVEKRGNVNLEPPSIFPDLPTANDVLGLPDTEQLSKSIVYISIGGVLMFVSIILAVRSFVPTQQIVKTIAAAA